MLDRSQPLLSIPFRDGLYLTLSLVEKEREKEKEVKRAWIQRSANEISTLYNAEGERRMGDYPPLIGMRPSVNRMTMTITVELTVCHTSPVARLDELK